MLIFGKRSLLSGLKVDVVDRQVRASLVGSLYSNPLSLVVGAICGAMVCLYAAMAARDFAMIVAASSLTVIAFVRILIMLAVRQIKRSNARTLELLFEAGAFAYAG